MGPAFKTADGEARFFAAYDAVLDQWPVAPEPVDIPSVYGTTRVHVCGPRDGAPLVLLHGGGATSTVWFANVGELSRTHRVHAVDIIGGAGRSVHNGRPTRTLADLIELTYRLRAVPLMARPTADRMRGFIRWETGDLAVNPAWLNLIALTAEFPESKIVMPRRPEAEQLAASTVPTLVLLAEKSRSHDIRRVAANARRLMPGAAITILPGVSHHSVPTENPATLNRELLEFLA